MFDFLNPRTEYGKMANSINKVNKMIQDLISENGGTSDIDEFTERILFIAYLIRKSVNDRMDMNNWPWETNMMVPSISRGVITLWVAWSKIVGDLNIIADQLELTDRVKEIMENNDVYYEYERSINEKERRRINKIFYFE